MDSLPIDSQEEQQTFHLIRLPKETVERAKGRSCKVGTLFVDHDRNTVEFRDYHSCTMYSLLQNNPIGNQHAQRTTQLNSQDESNKKPSTSTLSNSALVANSNETDLLKISLQRDEAVHFGKVKTSTFLAVPKVDETSASTAS